MWILYIAGGLVGLLIALIGLAALVGLMLPAAHVASRTVRVERAAADVWRALTDRASQPGWRRDLRRLEALPDVDGAPSFREHSRHGVITFVVDQSTPPGPGRSGLLVTRIADDTLPFGGRWIYQIDDDSGGARVTITEDGIVKNPVFRFMSRFVFGHTATLDAFLRDLAAHLSSPHGSG